MNRAQRRHGTAQPPRVFTPQQGVDAVLRQAASLHEAGRLQDAEIIYRRVLERQPSNPDALRLLALLAHQLGEHEVAAGYLTAAAQARPHDAQIPTDMGFVQLALGQPAVAEQHFRRALRVNPRKATAYHGLGDARWAVGAGSEAMAAYREALRLDPALVEGHINLGNALLAGGDFEAALACFQEAIRLAPHDVTAQGNAAAVLQRMGRASEALSYYQRALNGENPKYDLLCNFASALHATGQYQQASEVYALACQSRPEPARAHNGLAAAKLALFRPDEALPAATAALARDDGDPAARLSLAKALFMSGEAVRAQENFALLGSTQPGAGHDLSAATMLPIIYRSASELDLARAQYTKALSALSRAGVTLSDPLLQERSPFYLAYQGLNDRALQHQLASTYLSAAPGLGHTAGHCAAAAGARPPAGRVRVGFASAYLSEHTIGRLTAGVIQRLDRATFDVCVIHLGGAADGTAAAIDASADRAVYLTGALADMQTQVAALELDVLVYPEIGMEPRAYFLAFARLAPVQCAMWGHPVTTGIANVDYFLSSSVVEPPNAQRHYTERLVKLERLPAYYERPTVPAAPAQRDQFGLTSDDHVYLCPQSLFKLHPDFDSVVASILRADPAGRLVLLDGMSANWAALLRQRYAATLPDVAGRVVFAPRMSRDAFLGLLQTADVMLDPLHFGGGNSTYEALALGVPIVTLPGAFMRGRVTAGCYLQMGMTDLVATDTTDYAAKALRLANDGAWRSEMVARIHQTNHALFNDEAAVREFERFLLAAVAERTADTPRRTAWAA